jgi:hypothetical protein
MSPTSGRLAARTGPVGLVVVLGLLGLVAPLVLLAWPGRGHAAPPDPKTSGQALPPVCGTWVLQQSMSAAQLRSTREAVSTALATPQVRGFSSRAPWNAIDTDLALFEEAYRLAQAAGKQLSIRFMAGRWTPARVFDAGAYFYVNTAGERVPKPFSDTGVAGNPVFEREFEKAVARLAAWARERDVRLLHLPWYGQKWAEIDNGDEIRAARGYSLESWIAGHERLIDIARRYAGPDLSMEFAMSGHWGSDVGRQRDFFAHVLGKHREWSPYFFLQGNGLGVFNGSPTSREIFRGMQMYGLGDYDWGAVYGALRTAGATYVEVYTPSFTLANRTALAREIAAYYAEFDGSCRWR